MKTLLRHLSLVLVATIAAPAASTAEPEAREPAVQVEQVLVAAPTRASVARPGCVSTPIPARAGGPEPSTVTACADYPPLFATPPPRR